jgi:hypothetical protein
MEQFGGVAVLAPNRKPTRATPRAQPATGKLDPKGRPCPLSALYRAGEAGGVRYETLTLTNPVLLALASLARPRATEADDRVPQTAVGRHAQQLIHGPLEDGGTEEGNESDLLLRRVRDLLIEDLAPKLGDELLADDASDEDGEKGVCCWVQRWRPCEGAEVSMDPPPEAFLRQLLLP